MRSFKTPVATPAIVIGFLLLIPGCKSNPSSPPYPQPSVTLSVVPDIGTVNTIFRFAAVVRLDGDTVTTTMGYGARWDWDGDGTYDTPWLDSLRCTHLFGELGTMAARVQVRSPDGMVDTVSVRVYVQELVQITTNESSSLQGNIDWSRDGTNRIAFSWVSGSAWDRIWCVQYPDGIPEPVTSDSDTGIGGFNDFPEWSPDGRQISFIAEDLFVVDLSSRVPTCLGRAASHVISWSPDGRYILCGDSLYDLGLKSVSGVPFSAAVYSWSPEGDRIATAIGHENAQFRVVAFSSFTILAERSVPFCGEKLDWSADGRFIAMGFEDGQRGYVLEYQTGKVIRISVDGLSSCWWPSWSPDGTLLAFEARDLTSNRKHEIWAIRFPSDWE